MHKFYLRVQGIVIIAGIMLLFACDHSVMSNRMREGVIEYDITYLQDERENPLISLLPTTMTIKFRDNVSIQKIEGWMGIFSMAGIADREHDYSAALLKIMNEKYVYETTMSGPAFGFDEMPGLKIVKTDGTKVISGITCNKADVYTQNDTLPAFSIYYTDKIGLENPNCHNPFKEVDGVLLEFQMSFQKIPMRLVATKVVQEDVSDDEFQIPEDYKKVPMAKMQEVISNLM